VVEVVVVVEVEVGVEVVVVVVVEVGVEVVVGVVVVVVVEVGVVVVVDMSNLLSQVTHTSNTQTGIRVVIAGVEKVGKTTMACNAPRVLLIPLETGYSGVSVNKVPMLQTYDEVIALLDEIIAAAQKGKFQFKTLVFDSASALERIIHDRVLQSDPAYGKGNKKALTMGAALGGYGKAFQYANELFSVFLFKVDQLAVHASINIIMTCHVFPGKVIDPAYGEYDTWDLLLHSPKDSKGYGKRELITQWADVIGFLHEPLFVTKTSDTFNQGISANKGRILGLERTPGYVAGNRFGIKGEISIPKEQCWNYLAQAIFSSCGLDVYNKD
jgi:hypothetical protein